MRIIVQFYSVEAQKHLTISSHKNLQSAIKKAQSCYVEGYPKLNILVYKDLKVMVLNHNGDLLETIEDK